MNFCLSMKGENYMKKLREFMNFNYSDFFADKRFVLKDIRPYYSYVDGKPDVTSQLGVKYDCLISVDNTNYKDGQTHANEFEQISFKVPGETATNKFPRRSKVEPIEVTKCSVYGDFQNNLSIEVKGMRLLKEGIK